MKVVALAGGTGSAKLLRGLAKVADDLTVVANVGDNFRIYGVYVCPDVDIAMYTLAGIADQKKGWGIGGDTFNLLEMLSLLGEETWFKLGDRDFGLCALRTDMIRKGASLTDATLHLCRRLGVTVPVLPTCDVAVETRVVTDGGVLHLQEFWVKKHGEPEVTGVRYAGAGNAAPSKQVTQAINGADRIVICPANPVTSIGPMLATHGLRKLIINSSARVVALSPMTGRVPFSGPAGKLMAALGVRPDSTGVAWLYRRFLDSMIISRTDGHMLPGIEKMGIHCIMSETRIRGPDDGVRLSRELLEA